MKKLIVIFIILCGVLNAQEKEQSSLYKAILNCTDSSSKLKLYRDLATNYHQNNLYERSIHFQKKGLDLATQLGDTTNMIEFNILLLGSYTSLGMNADHLDACFSGLKLAEIKKDRSHIGFFYRVIGQAYWAEKDNKKALEYYQKALKIATELNDTSEIAGLYNNLGLAWRSLKNYDKANDYYFKAIDLAQLNNNDLILTRTFNNIAYIRYMKKDLLGALEYYKLSLKHAKATRDEYQTGLVMGNIGSMYLELHDAKQAMAYIDSSLKIAIKVGDLMGQVENYYNTATMYSKAGKYKESLMAYQAYMDVVQKQQDENNEKDLKREEAKREYENELNDMKQKQELKDAIAKAEKEKNRMILISVILGFLIVVVLLIIIYNRFKLSQSQKIVIENQKKLVDEKQKEILDSIHYAKRIQATLLANKDLVDAYIPNNFIYFQPKDIVSGDFYWATEHNGYFFLAVCDSTGHGVPGAFMSLLNIGFLTEAINEKNIIEPAKIFDHSRARLINGISKEGQKDGFDGALLRFDKDLRKITYVGANNAIVLVKNNVLMELETNKMPVGIGERDKNFTQGEYELQEGDMIYIYTDGYADQFGGPKGKKFKSGELNKLLQSITHLPVNEQKHKLEQQFNAWRGDLEQVDVVLVVGIKL